jgi:hypothetical protein
MGMYRLSDPCQRPAALYDLLDPPGSRASESLPYTYNYVSELQSLSEQVDKVVQAESLDPGRRSRKVINNGTEVRLSGP